MSDLEVSKEELAKVAKQMVTSGGIAPTVLRLNLVNCFTTLFCRWRFQGEDLIVQLFPRAGPNDVWSEGQYLPKCRSCKSEKKDFQKKCRRCGERGQVYIPGRAEVPGPIQFPQDFMIIMKGVADKVWAGEVNVGYIQELGAYALKFNGAVRSGAALIERGLLDKFLSKLDEALDTAPKIQVARR